MKLPITKSLGQRGVTPLAIIVLFVVVIAVAGIGFMVYNNGKKPAASIDVAGPAQTTTPTPANDTSTAPTNNAPTTLAYSKVPKELQAAILDYTKATASTCVVNDQIVDIDQKPHDQDVYYSQSSAITTIGCDGGASTLFVKRDSGTWEMVEKTQLAFSCDSLKTNKVSPTLLTLSGAEKAQCNDGSDIVDYIQ